MADRSPWLKLWTSVIHDMDMANLTCQNMGRWIRLLALTKANGAGGVLKLSFSAKNTFALLDVESLDELYGEIDTWDFPGITCTPNRDDDGIVELVIVWNNWVYYQGPVDPKGAERQQRYIQKKAEAVSDASAERQDGVISLLPSTFSNIPSEDIKEGVKEESEPSEGNGHVPYSEVLSLLNDATGKAFRNTAKFKDLVKARWNEGNRLDDFQSVITKKTAEWKGTDSEKYLRPETIFGPKFDGYRNQPDRPAAIAKPSIHDIGDFSDPERY